MAFEKKWKNSTGTKAYYAWRSMRLRCGDKNNPSYANYGGRGITVCERWENNFDAFIEDMGHPPSGKSSLDRIDFNKGYSPDNCRWADLFAQANNKRTNRLIECFGRTQTLSQWAREFGWSTDTMFKRLERMPPEKAFTCRDLNKVARHGTRQMYSYHKCRCDECKAFNAEYHRAQRKRRAQNKAIDGAAYLALAGELSRELQGK